MKNLMPTPEDIFEFVETLAARERLYATVGKVASNWAALELFINSSLWVLAKVEDEAGACLTAQIPNVSRSLDAFASLVRLRGGNDILITAINKFTERTHALAQRRNRIIHDPWNWDDETGKPHRVRVSAQKKLVFGPEPMEIAEVSKLIDEISDHVDAFQKIVDDVSRQLGTSAGIHFRRFTAEPPPAAPED